MKLLENNNKKCIQKIAVKSVKYSRLRNIFIVITIALSTSLLAFMGNFALGQRQAGANMVDTMQQVLYYNTTKEQIAQLKADARVEEYHLYKSGKTVDTGDNTFYPMFVDNREGKIQRMSVSQGSFPQTIKEAAVFPEFLQKLGIEAKLGQTISLTFLDGTEEEFTVTGFLKGMAENHVYPVLVSEEYAETGSQLKDVSYNMMVNLTDARKMSQDEFKAAVWELGDTCGIGRTDVNTNGSFERILMGNFLMQENFVYGGIGLFLLIVSILVIYSIFYISVIGRIRQFGQMRTLGMTKKQIRKMIRIEGAILGAAGIFLGLAAGTVAGAALYIDGFKLKSSLLLALGVTAVEAAAIFISIRKPARIASEISPIEAAKYVAYQGNGKKTETRALHRRITPLGMAKMGFSRNIKKTMITMVTLGLGGILFMCGTMILTSTNREEYSRQGEFAIGEYQISFSSNALEMAEHGVSEFLMKNLFNEEMKEEISNIEGVEKIYAPKRMSVETFFQGEPVENSLGTFTADEVKEMEEALEGGGIDYQKMTGLPGILVQGNSQQIEIFGEGYQLGDEVELTFYNGKEVRRTFTVVGFLDIGYQKELGRPFFWVPEETIQDMIGNMNLTRSLIIKTDRTKEAEITRKLKEITEGNSNLELSTLSQRMEADKNTFYYLYGVVLGISGFIILFSMINLINTMITNILTRKQEFAVLQSLGMSNRQLSWMIQFEGLIIVLGNAVVTLVLGTAAGWLMFYGLSHIGVDYFHYHFPGWYFAAYVIFSVMVPAVVSNILVERFKKEAVVERMKMIEQ